MDSFLNNMKGPSKFSRGQSPQYQLALIKKFSKMRERNARRLKAPENKLF